MVLRSLPLTQAFYKSIYLEVIAVVHYNKHDDVIHPYTLYACVHQSKYNSAIKRILVCYRHENILVFFHVFVCSL